MIAHPLRGPASSAVRIGTVLIGEKDRRGRRPLQQIEISRMKKDYKIAGKVEGMQLNLTKK